MLDFYDTPLYCEEEFILKIKGNLMDQFALDNFSANDLALEILELLTVSDSNIELLNKYFINND